MALHIREAVPADFDSLWPILHAVFRAAQTYALAPDMTRDEAYTLWCETPLATFVAEGEGEIIGTYYLKKNAAGPGDHVCNCGYIVAAEARGRGVAGAMCEHSQQIARTHGFKAMQFNSVVSTNEGAVRLWQKLGFDIVGTLPRAYRHTSLGFVDAYVMYKWLG
ncbi:GNAT family N-acetyltransferase [Phytohalomonas tamaricis]|uniref:GNAT family N-acetyltransferase n=1 Tax=Phytohalomonas tamaricis TaxID=2081032 RepID=UPI000D0B0E61|nr:GNAT family N-acetyltransferase [Phytohalomonas tamaricis]